MDFAVVSGVPDGKYIDQGLWCDRTAKPLRQSHGKEAVWGSRTREGTRQEQRLAWLRSLGAVDLPWVFRKICPEEQPDPFRLVMSQIHGPFSLWMWVQPLLGSQGWSQGQSARQKPYHL